MYKEGKKTTKKNKYKCVKIVIIIIWRKTFKNQNTSRFKPKVIILRKFLFLLGCVRLGVCHWVWAPHCCGRNKRTSKSQGTL